MPAITDETEIASGFTVKQYKDLRDRLGSSAADAWTQIVDVIRRRFEERYSKPVEKLEQHDRDPNFRALSFRPGFVIVAVDCVLIDAIQAFREGRTDTGDESPAKAFKEFLKAPRFAAFNSTDRKEFFNQVRNALLHNAETRQNWVIQRLEKDDGPVLEKAGGRRVLNRRAFHRAVQAELKDLVDQLKTERDSPLRASFLQRMDSLCGLADKSFHFFAYGSGLDFNELRKTLPNVQGHGCVAYLPRYSLAFNKHSDRRSCDAANLQMDDVSVVWGYCYRFLPGSALSALGKREGGYRDVQLRVFDDDGEWMDAKVFICETPCPKACGPSAEYRRLVIEAAKTRRLPESYLTTLS